MFGCRVEHIINDRGDVETTKGPLNSDLLIGADGIHSKPRPYFGPEPRAPFTGQVAWRALVQIGSIIRTQHGFMGPHRHIVSYPLRGGDILNVVMVQEQANWAQDGWNVQMTQVWCDICLQISQARSQMFWRVWTRFINGGCFGIPLRRNGGATVLS